jgi:hypothetical protein
MTKRSSWRLVAASSIAAWLVALAGGASAQAPDDGGPLVSIKELMEKTITAASNRLWNVPDAATDEEWAALEEAAVTLLVAANVAALGGTGPMDNSWVKEPAWTAFNRAMIAAGRDALAAARARDRDALVAAGDVLYPPCEGCHLQFNPGVVEASQ